MNEDLQTTEQEEGLEQDSKTYTQDQVMELLQSETDKRVQQALKTQQKKFDKEIAKQKSLSQLDTEQREQAEKDMRIQELEEKLKEFNVMRTKSEITQVLNDRGLNHKFADIISVGEDIEEAQQKIDLLDKLFKAQVKAEVEKRMGSSTPKTSTIGLEQGMTKEKFNMLNDSEKIAYLMDNPNFLR